MLLRYIFGDDIFISYSRKDGKPYATKLKEQLKSMDYSCFIDFEKVYPGDHLSGRLQRALRRSRVLVVVGTEGARRSPYVRQEIDEFLKTGRTLIPIDIQDALVNPQWDVLAANELVWIDDARLETPSPEIFQEIKRLFKHNRRNVWVRAVITSTALVLLVISVVAVLMAMRARASQLEAERQTAALKTEQQKVLEQTAALLTNQQELAARNKELKDKNEALISKTEEAEKARKAAQENAAKARLQEQAALRNAQLARQQQQLATERQQLAFSRELASNAISQLPYDAELGVLLAGHAMSVSPTREAEDALRQSLAAYPASAVFVGSEHNLVNGAAFSPDGTLAVTASGKDRVQVFNVSTGKRLAELVPPDDRGLRTARFAPDSRLIVAACSDGACVWDAMTGRLLQSLKGHRGINVDDVAFSPDGKYVAMASDDGTAPVWDLSSGDLVVLGSRGDPPLKHVRFNRGGRRVVTAGHDSKVKVWDVKTRDVKVFDATDGPVTSVEFSPDGGLLVASHNGLGIVAQVIDANTGRISQILRGETGSVTVVNFSPDGRWILTGTDGQIIVWETATGKALKTLSGHTGFLRQAEFSHDGKLLLSVGDDKTVRLWQVETGNSVELKGHDGKVFDAEFSPDDRYVVTGGEDKTARIWDVKTSRLLRTLSGQSGEIFDVEFSRDGRSVVTASAGAKARVWQVETGQFVEMECRKPYAASFSADGRYVLTKESGGVSSLAVCDAATGKEPVLQGKHGYAMTVGTLSPDGGLLAGTGEDKVLRMWELETGKVVNELRGIYGPLSISPDGHSALIMRDGSYYIYPWEALAPIGTLLNEAPRVTPRRFST